MTNILSKKFEKKKKKMHLFGKTNQKIMKTKLLIIAMFFGASAYANDGEKQSNSNFTKLELCERTVTSSASAVKTCEDGSTVTVTYTVTETVVNADCQTAEAEAAIISNLKAHQKLDNALPGIDYMC